MGWFIFVIGKEVHSLITCGMKFGSKIAGRSKDPISHFQAYLTDLWQKTSAMHRRGVDVDQAAEQIDMTNHSENYGQLRSPGVDPRAIRRIYELLDSR